MKKETILKSRKGVRAGSICQTECFISSHIPGLKKKKVEGGIQHFITLNREQIPIQELGTPSEASLESLLAPRKKEAKFSNFCKKTLYQICSFLQRRARAGSSGKAVLGLEQPGSQR